MNVLSGNVHNNNKNSKKRGESGFFESLSLFPLSLFSSFPLSFESMSYSQKQRRERGKKGKREKQRRHRQIYWTEGRKAQQEIVLLSFILRQVILLALSCSLFFVLQQKGMPQKAIISSEHVSACMLACKCSALRQRTAEQCSLAVNQLLSYFFFFFVVFRFRMFFSFFSCWVQKQKPLLSPSQRNREKVSRTREKEEEVDGRGEGVHSLAHNR